MIMSLFRKQLSANCTLAAQGFTLMWLNMTFHHLPHSHSSAVESVIVFLSLVDSKGKGCHHEYVSHKWRRFHEELIIREGENIL